MLASFQVEVLPPTTTAAHCHHPMMDAFLEIQWNLCVHMIQLFSACGFH